MVTLTTEIASIQKVIEEQKNTLKEKKTALKKAEKEVASLEAKKAKVDAKVAEEATGKWDECGRNSGETEISKCRVDKLNSRSSHGIFEGCHIVYNGNRRKGA